MRIFDNFKSHEPGSRLSVNLKKHVNPQSPLADLRNNLNEKSKIREYAQKLITNEQQMGSMLDTISSTEEDHRVATVTGWSTVYIANCAGVSNSSIFVALKWVMMPIKVKIFNFKRSGPEDDMARGQFLVDNLLSANRLKRLQDEVAVINTCQKIEVRVTPGLPKSVMGTQITEEFTTAVEVALRSRYEVASRTLDLSRFHASPELAVHFCPLHVVKLLETVLVLSSHIFPHVTGIVLSNNYLCSLKAFAGNSQSFASLERLDISANRIQDLGELNYINKLSCKTIFLAGNGLAKQCVDVIRKMLPQLKNVHGCVQLGESTEAVDNLPKFQQLQGGGTNGLEFCQRFISLYYTIFDDTEKRFKLKKYYDDQAMFSLSVPVQLNYVYGYKLYNRNQKHQHSSFAQNAKLQVGSAELLLALSRLPLMLTDLQNVGLDIQVFTSSLRIFTLTGYFEETSSDTLKPRRFQRTFVLQTLNRPGWLITNDMLCITSTMPEPKESIIFKPQTNLINTDPSVKKINKPAATVVKTLHIKTKAKKKVQISSPLLGEELNPLNQAVKKISLSDSQMDHLPIENFNDMPPLVPIGPLTTNRNSLDEEMEDILLADENSFELDIMFGCNDL
ncbi:nuclear RNA export factor 1 [Drosophila mauritiana]|uniref:Nuclear RNA export factor 1 n=1 Tax=Drosophila mauritiana TaxID=7226 RepID=A0A6P8JY80_DROMA|nr:nuclear RNA export factor 1 [Drosophila mauritiana]